MVCGGVWWCVVVCGGVWWCVVVCGGIGIHDDGDNALQMERSCDVCNASWRAARDVLFGGHGCRSECVNHAFIQHHHQRHQSTPRAPAAGGSVLEMTVFTHSDTTQHINRE
jgi:hypothetical protein